jgi:uncharacterized protein YndB with AHSA1/START domain
MKAKKMVVYATASLIGLMLAILTVGVFSPSEYRVVRSVVVDAPAGKVFEPIVRLPEWNQWSTRNTQSDPTLKYTYGGEPGSVGSYMAWESEVGSTGKLTLMDIVPDSRIKYTLSMEGGKFHGAGSITLNPVAGGTRVVWEDTGNLGNNPLYKFMGLFMDAMLGADFEKGLKRLKANLEGKS